jgi:formate hydrogenlyase transcriptional activator
MTPTLPSTLSDLPHFAFSRLAHMRADAVDEGLTSLLEVVCRMLDAEGACLIDVASEPPTAPVLFRWERPGSLARPALAMQTCPSLLGQLLCGQTVLLGGNPAGPDEDPACRDLLAAHGLRGVLIAPVATHDRTYALAIENPETRGAGEADVHHLIAFTAAILAHALEHSEVQRELMRTRADLARFTQRLESQTRVVREDLLSDYEDLVGRSPAFLTAVAAVQDVAPTDTTVLLLGETGTGKELFARALHERSARRQRPFICVNCAALPSSLIESELFGHERGAFTGAVAARQGRFELADRGTIFLDEIGDLPLDLQPKLLRVLQEREIERIGSSTRRRVDVRVVAATHHDLPAAVAQGRFRADLYYRLSVFPIALPPLRDRPEDIPHLVWFLINQRQRRLHRRITDIAADSMAALQRYHWPGNVRELENVLERAMIRSTGPTLYVDDPLAPASSAEPTIRATDATLRALERDHIEAMLRRCRGRINGPGNAAERLGLHPNTLRFRMKKLGIVRQTNLWSMPGARTVTPATVDAVHDSEVGGEQRNV